MTDFRQVSREEALGWAKELFKDQYSNSIVGKGDTCTFTIKFSEPKYNKSFVFMAEELITEKDLKVESYYIKLGFASDTPKPPSEDYKDRLWAAIKLASEG